MVPVTDNVRLRYVNDTLRCVVFFHNNPVNATTKKQEQSHTNFLHNGSTTHGTMTDCQRVSWTNDDNELLLLLLMYIKSESKSINTSTFNVTGRYVYVSLNNRRKRNEKRTTYANDALNFKINSSPFQWQIQSEILLNGDASETRKRNNITCLTHTHTHTLSFILGEKQQWGGVANFLLSGNNNSWNVIQNNIHITYLCYITILV